MTLNRDKFAMICGMLGSEFDGERAAAALAASAMLKAAGMTWADVLENAVDQTEDKPTGKAANYEGFDASLTILACMRRIDDCASDWDADFIENLEGLRVRFKNKVKLSEKQWTQLIRIGEHLGVLS